MPLATSEVPLALAFGAGLIATVNPCGFAMLPSFIAYYLGSGGSAEDGAGRLAEGLLAGLVVTAGFMLVFGTAGAAFALGARAIVNVVPWLAIVVGATLIALGVWLLAGKHLTIRIPGMRPPEGPGYRSMFAFGIAYATGSLSCTLPVFLVVVGSATAAGSAPGTLGVFLAYGLGMSTILMLLCLGTASFRELLVRVIRPVMPHMNRISGALLVLGGGYVVYYWTSLLSGNDESGPVRFVQQLQGRAQDLIQRPADRIWLAAGVALLVGALLSLGLRRARSRAAMPQERGDEPHDDLEPEYVQETVDVGGRSV